MRRTTLSHHLTRGTAQRRDATRTTVRYLTVVTAAGAVVGTAGVAMAMTPDADAVPAKAVAPQPVAPVKRVAPPRSLAARRTAPAPVRAVAPPPAPVTTSGGS